MADSCVVPLWVLSAGFTSTALRVYISICSHINTRGEAWPSQTRLANLCACSVDQVRRAVAELKQRGLIRVIPLHGRRHLTYVVLRRVGLAPPSPFIYAASPLAPVQGEEIREVKIHTKESTEWQGRQSEEKIAALDHNTQKYIEDSCYVKSLGGRLSYQHAYRRNLVKLALRGELNMADAETVHKLAEALRTVKARR